MNSILEKADYCASCVTKPCQVGCPFNNNITSFIKDIKNEDYEHAYRVLCQTTVLPAVCGRVCPYDKQCQGACVKKVSYDAVRIGELEAFIGDLSIKNNWSIVRNDCPKRWEKVAIVGGGPSGLVCAAFLAINGISSVIYEKHNYLGGILSHGIPEFRLPKDILKKTIDKILDLGVEVKFNQELGRDITLDYLEKEYDAIFLGIGGNISLKMHIPGEDLSGVYGGNEILENNSHPDYHGKTVVVSGGGNVAMDVSRTVKRLGAEHVYVIYRRGEKEMPATKEEIADAKKDGVEFLFQHNILKIDGVTKVKGVEVIKTDLIQKEGESRLSPVNIEGSNYHIPCDYVMMAIGSMVEESVVSGLGLERTPRGKVKIDQEGRTSRVNIFAGGDLTNTPGTVAFAGRSGRDAAYAIIEYLDKKNGN